MAKKSKGISKGIIAGITALILVAVLIILAFSYVNNEKAKEVTTEPAVEISAVDGILLSDFDRNYPPTPKEVVKMYSEITTCFYNEKMDEVTLEKLAEKSRELCDEELVANQSFEDYVDSLKTEILSFNSKSLTVSGYTLSSAADVEYYSVDNFNFAKLYVTYRLRQGTEFVYSNEVFLLRKDDDGHWKIYGFTLADDEEASEDTTGAVSEAE